MLQLEVPTLLFPLPPEPLCEPCVSTSLTFKETFISSCPRCPRPCSGKVPQSQGMSGHAEWRKGGNRRAGPRQYLFPADEFSGMLRPSLCSIPNRAAALKIAQSLFPFSLARPAAPDRPCYLSVRRGWN